MTGVAPEELAEHAFLRGMPAAQVAPITRASTLVTAVPGHRGDAP